MKQNACGDDQVQHGVTDLNDKLSSPEHQSQKGSPKAGWKKQEGGTSHGEMRHLNQAGGSAVHASSFGGVPRYAFSAAAHNQSSAPAGERYGVEKDYTQPWPARSVPPPSENFGRYLPPYNHLHHNNSPPLTPREGGYSSYARQYQQHHERPYPNHFTGTSAVPPAPAQGFGYDRMPPMMAPYHVCSSFESPHMHAGGGSDINPTSTSALAHYHPLFPPPVSDAARGYPVIQWAPIPQVEYVTNIKPSDVLSGRGGATNSHSGNRVFRSLVKRFQSQYLRAKKRDKPAVASIIVEKIREKGGRFLRRIDTTRHGQVLWFDIGDDRAREKTCQALREGAPELRRKRKAASADEDDMTKQSESADENERVLCSTFSSTDATPESIDEKACGHLARNKPAVEMANADFTYRHSIAKDGPVMIRPSPRLLQGRNCQPLSVDQLDPMDREIYLRDFLPPDPTIRRKITKRQVVEVSRTLLGINTVSPGDVDTARGNPWPIVKV